MLACALGAAGLPAVTAASYPGANAKIYTTTLGQPGYAPEDLGTASMVSAVDPLTGAVSKVRVLPIGMLPQYPSVAADGRTLAYATLHCNAVYTPDHHTNCRWVRELHVVDLASPTATDKLVETLPPDVNQVTGLAISPDATKIAYSTMRGLDTPARRNPLHVVNVDGSRDHMLATSNGLASPVLAPDWSPDGTRIAALRVVPSDGPPTLPHLVTIDARSGAEQIITADVGSPPSWSPDGTKIAYASNGDIYTVAQDGSDRRLIVAGARANDVDWSADGSALLASSWDRNLTIYDGAGGLIRTVVRDFTGVGFVWAPQRAAIATKLTTSTDVRVSFTQAGVARRGMLGLQATLTDAHGVPLAGRRLTFRSHGRALCRRVTDGAGYAFCGLGRQIGRVRKYGYTAVFAQAGDVLGSAAYARLARSPRPEQPARHRRTAAAHRPHD